jgi:hypothetical protein
VNEGDVEPKKYGAPLLLLKKLIDSTWNTAAGYTSDNNMMKLLAVIVFAMASPIMVVVATTATTGGTKKSLSSLFGVVGTPQRKTTILGCIPRGGAVHESSTLSDLESKIQSGALQEKLSVIDFTATW